MDKAYYKAVIQMTDSLTARVGQLPECEQVMQALTSKPSAVNNVILTKLINKTQSAEAAFNIVKDHPSLGSILP